VTPDEVLALLNDDPFAQQLLTSAIPARLAYVALDGTPRAIPIAYHFTGRSIVLATPDGAPKIRALQAHPAVALTIDTETQPPLVLMVRGTASVTFVDGVVPEYLAANRRMLPPGAHAAFEQQVTALYDRMARIEITPTWATVLDFQTRAPRTVMKIAAAKGLTPQ
jgi:hypothetical protein